MEMTARFYLFVISFIAFLLFSFQTQGSQVLTQTEMSKQHEEVMSQNLKPEKHRNAIFQLAKSGNIFSAARMIDLNMWDEMADIPPGSFSDLQDKNLVIGKLSVKQIVGIVLANWCTRNTKDQKTMIEARDLIAADTLEHHAAYSELSWLLRDYEPKNLERSDELSRKVNDLLEKQITQVKQKSIDPLFDGALYMASAYYLVKNKKDCAQTFDRYKKAYDLYVQAGDKKGQGACLGGQAWCLQPDNNPKGDWQKAYDLYIESVRLLSEAGDKKGLGKSLYQQAWCLQPDHNPKGDWQKAFDLYAASVLLRGEVGDKKGQAKSLYMQAWCLQRDHNPKGDWQKTFELYAQSNRLSGEVGDKKEQAKSLYMQAWCLQPDNNPKGDWQKAGDLYAESARLRGEIGDKKEQAKSLYQQAWCLQRDHNPKGDWQKTFDLYAESNRLSGEVGDKKEQAKSLYMQAWCLQPDNNPKGDWQKAFDLYAASVLLRGEVGDKKGQAKSLYMQAWCLQPNHNPKGDWQKATDLYAESVLINNEIGDKKGQGNSLHQQVLCMIQLQSINLTDSTCAMLMQAARLQREGGDEKGAEKSEGFANKKCDNNKYNDKQVSSLQQVSPQLKNRESSDMKMANTSYTEEEKAALRAKISEYNKRVHFCIAKKNKFDEWKKSMEEKLHNQYLELEAWRKGINPKDNSEIDRYNSALESYRSDVAKVRSDATLRSEEVNKEIDFLQNELHAYEKEAKKLNISVNINKLD